jgi:hypothetical protein
MTDSALKLALICALFAGQSACSANAPATSGQAAGGSGNHGGDTGSAGQAGGSAAGSSNASGGASAAGTGGSAGGGGGAMTAGAGGAGNSTSGGASGASGSAGAGGSGMPVSCTPGTGTQPVGANSQLDQKTCLTWTLLRSSTTLTNKQAYKYCNDLSQDGITDWRVPSPEELVTWPGLVTDSTAYITGPIYIPNNAASVMDGCVGDSHSCNIAKYNDTSVTCGWQGVGFAGWVACVSGTATAGSTNAAYSAASCSPCNSELASFTVTDCSAYAN